MAKIVDHDLTASAEAVLSGCTLFENMFFLGLNMKGMAMFFLFHL